MGKAENAKRREGNLSAFCANSRVVFSPLLDSQLPETYGLRTTFQKCAPEIGRKVLFFNHLQEITEIVQRGNYSYWLFSRSLQNARFCKPVGRSIRGQSVSNNLVELNRSAVDAVTSLVGLLALHL